MECWCFRQSIRYFETKRKPLLEETDWTANSDSTHGSSNFDGTYRQDLRDITNGLTTVEEVEATNFLLYQVRNNLCH